MIVEENKNKDYKFKFEIEDLVYDDDDNRKLEFRYRFIGYGNTAKEAIDNYEELLEEWHKRCSKSMKGSLNNKKDLT